jgi:hypothetical protein
MDRCNTRYMQVAWRYTVHRLDRAYPSKAEADIHRLFPPDHRFQINTGRNQGLNALSAHRYTHLGHRSLQCADVKTSISPSLQGWISMLVSAGLSVRRRQRFQCLSDQHFSQHPYDNHRVILRQQRGYPEFPSRYNGEVVERQ